MKIQYDLHLHSCLSPCGSDDMTPCNMVNMAALLGFDMIAITDHNSCLNAQAAIAAGKQAGVTVVPGMELCTAEEAHVVCLFPTLEDALQFQVYVDGKSYLVENRPDIFGRQLIMGEGDVLLGEESRLLLNATKVTAQEASCAVRLFHGAAFTAHIDRDSFSLLASLGSIPPEAEFRAAEITASGDVEKLLQMYPELRDMILLLDSDAHYLENMQDPGPWLDLPENTAACLIDALNGTIKATWGRT